MRINISIRSDSVGDHPESKMTKFIITFLILCTMFCSTALAQTKPDDPLDEDSAAALIEKLTEGIEAAIEDEESLEAISEKWSSRNLVGKTRKQAIDILFADVKSVVKDAEILKKIWDSWNASATAPDPVETPKPQTPPPTVEKPAPTPTPQPTPTPGTTDPNVTPTSRSAPEEMIDLGEPPLSAPEMDEVMKWIAASTSALRLPFCWKQSYGRTAGTPMICKPGYNQDTAGLCYKQCGQNERGIATFCYSNCPEGLPDNGLYCEKRGEYGRGAGYPIWDEGRCNNDNPQGCEKSGLIWYPKCKAGYSPFGCCLCKPSCPQGWEDIGVSCKKPNYAREVLPLTECPPGTERNGALCYPICKNDFAGNGPVCWQKCPSQLPWDCGAACATDQKECAMAVLKQVTAPIMAAISIVSLGSASAVTAPLKAAQVATSVSRLTKAVTAVKTALTAAKGSITSLVGGAQNLAKIQQVAKVGGKIYVAASAVGREVDLFSREFADNFDVWTSPAIAREIDQRFGREAAYQIKRQWGLRHLTLMLEADGFATGKNVLSLVSIADPTGLVAVAEAFMHPICKPDVKFPTVNPLYNR